MDTTISEKVPEGILEEYNSLKCEIFQSQNQRMQIISFTVAAVGVLLSIIGNVVLGSKTIQLDRKLLVAVGGAVAIYVILIPSLIMMISNEQAIQRLGCYIRLFIEPQVPGLNWEHHWQEFRSKHLFKGLHGLGSIYYYLTILPLLLPGFVLAQFKQGWCISLILIPFVIWSFYMSYDLQAGVSKNWKLTQWEEYITMTSNKGVNFKA